TFPGGASAERQIKTLVFAHSEHDPSQRGAGGAYRYVTAILRGDHQLHETKLVDALGGGFVRPAHAEEIVGLLGASPGSLGAVGAKDIIKQRGLGDVYIVADAA